MRTKAVRRGDRLYIYLSGELDEHSALQARAETDALIDANAGASCAVFGLEGVKFMDSAGIGFLIGRYKRLRGYGMGMYLSAPNAGADKILEMSGLYSIMPKI